MTVIAGLLDALLAARLAPRLDVLGIKGETAIGAPGAVIGVDKVANDVRLPSNAALDRLIPVGTSGGASSGTGGSPSAQTQLSMAARVISAVLADLGAAPGPVRGASPMLASGQPLAATALAGTLAQTVADSGMFYESHLVQFVAGGRSLAQMAQEPQAKWSVPMAAARPAAAAAMAQALSSQAAAPGDLPEGAPAASTTTTAGSTTATALATQLAPLPEGAASRAPNPSAAQAAAPAAGTAANGSAPSGMNAALAADALPSADAARVQAAYRQPDATATTPDAMQAHRAAQADAARQLDSPAVSPASRSASGTEVIHPQAVTIVHQQLDLLASANFRWSGQAWPDVPMTWSIEEEQRQPDARGGADAQDEATRHWSTTVSLVLPRLGEVDLRLSLVGPSVQAQLSARDADTMACLRGDAGRLTRRFEAAGLQLQQLQFTAKEAHA